MRERFILLKGIALLEEALTLLRRGRFLQEETGIWAHGRRENLQTLSHSCLLRLVLACERLRQWKPAQRIAERLVYENPLDENGLRHLMLVLHQQGDTSEALRRYQTATSLFNQVGRLCSAKTGALAQRLRENPRTLPIPLEDEIHPPSVCPLPAVSHG